MSSAVLCVEASGGIGFKNDLPWPKFKEDLKLFKKYTFGKPIIMGRKTYESLPGKLPQRHHVVISKTWERAEHQTIELFRSLEEALQAYPFGVIIGGASLYDRVIEESLVHEIQLTRIRQHYDHDVSVNLRNLAKNYTCVMKTDLGDGYATLEKWVRRERTKVTNKNPRLVKAARILGV